ncbi:helix-turn-helix domain-containing protein [Streptomyces sp. NPDC006684]|uniref:helix-turn-helix domain-containing protein n=1 Tax=unclassified Streptomyces TaxID=2593676 RepID=UPI00031D0E73|nr:helix-turn-helix transcriptional regulator [Streptomyces sp. Tu6071]
MENQEDGPVENFAQLLQRLKVEYGVSDSEIARRIDVSVSTVNTWVHNKRTPRRDALERLSAAFPKYSLAALSEAAGREAPGELSPDREARLLELIRDLTPDQQGVVEIQLKALRDANQRG